MNLGARRFKRTLSGDWLRFWAYLLWPLVPIGLNVFLLPLPQLLTLGICGLFMMPLAASRVVGFRRGEVCVDEEGVQLPGGAIERSAIRTAFYVPAAAERPGRLELQGEEGRPLGAIEIDDPADAARAIDALRMSGTQPVTYFSAVAPSWSPAARGLKVSMLLGMVGLGIGVVMTLPVLVALGLLVATAVPLALVRARVEVGADGMVVVTRGSRRYFGWADVRDVVPSEEGIVIQTSSGDFAVPTVSGFRELTDSQKEAQAALIEKTRQARTRHGRRASRGLVKRLARHGRPVEEWLRALGNSEGDFRSAPVSAEELLALVEDPSQQSTARAAAAVALRSSASDEDRDRIRIAAEACAGDKLRIALREAADPLSERALHEAVAALDADDGRARSRR